MWSFSPSLSFSNPNIDKNPNVNLNIWMDRNFIYDEELGWNWHKSWILPSICVKLEITDKETNEIYNTPKNTYAKIYAVKTST